jgi:hypothetical protein
MLVSQASLAVAPKQEITVDWSKLKLKAKAMAKPQAANTEWKSTELAAWQEGYRKIEAYYQDKLSGIAKQELRDLVRSKTQSANTTYYGDGSVAVEFEAALPEVVSTDLSTLAKPSDDFEQLSKNTGVVFRLNGPHSPSASYRVLSSEGGEVLFSLKDVGREGFQENLMGRWFDAKQKPSYLGLVGDNPVELSLNSNGTDLIIDKSSWQNATAGNQKIFRDAKIAIVVSSQP